MADWTAGGLIYKSLNLSYNGNTLIAAPTKRG
jgi:hypothetical protein